MKPTICDPDTGRPIYIGDGLIPQVERFASKYVYNERPTVEIFHTIMQTMNEKADKPTGNKLDIAWAVWENCINN